MTLWFPLTESPQSLPTHSQYLQEAAGWGHCVRHTVLAGS